MQTGTSTDDDVMAALALEFPDWHIWRGRSGTRPCGWYATRRRRLSNAELDAGLFRTLADDTAQGLHEQLRQQAAAHWEGSK